MNIHKPSLNYCEMNRSLTKKLTLISILLINLFSGCVEPEKISFDCHIANNSSSGLKVLLHRRSNIPPYDSISIAPGETSSIGSYLALSWSSYACDARKIQFIFDNGKGYVCTIMPNLTTNDSELCFLGGKDPFIAPRLPDEGLGSITTITQEDFENAFDL